MTDQSQNRPSAWYKNPFMTVFVVGLPALVVVVCIFFIIFSIKIQDSTVRDDWHMDGKTLYQDATRDKLAHDLGLTGVMRFDGDQVSFELNYPKHSLELGKLNNGDTLSYPEILKVSISHATDKNKDKDFDIKHIKDNLYQGQISLDDTPAKYYLQVSHSNPKNWRLIRSQKLPAKNVAFAPLSAFDETNQSLPDQKDKRANLPQTQQTQSQ